MLSLPDITLETMEALMARVAPTLATEDAGDEEDGGAPVVIKVRAGGRRTDCLACMCMCMCICLWARTHQSDGMI